MQNEPQVIKKNPFFKEVLFSHWYKAFMKPGEEMYFHLLERTSFMYLLVEILIFSILFAVSGVANRFSTAYMNISEPSITIFSSIFIAIILFMAINLLVFFLIKLFGGIGSYFNQLLMSALLLIPEGILLLIIQFVVERTRMEWDVILNPLSLSGLLGWSIILLGLYIVIINLLGLRVVHQIKATKVVSAIAILVGFVFLLRVVGMFVNQEETTLTRVTYFIIAQWESGNLQESLMGHIWLVLFAMIVAIIIGITIGVLITFPMRRPKVVHLGFLIPIAIFFVIWAASTGLFGIDVADSISGTMRSWDRNLKSLEGFFGELFVIIGSIIRKPQAIGVIGMILTLLLYVLFIVGEKASNFILYLAGIILTIPSIALFGVLIKPLGIGAFNAAFALILYAQLPILRNTYTGITEVVPQIVEAGRGMGMTEFQLLKDVKLPLAVPVIMTGLRVSTVMLVGIGAIAAYIGNTTMGDYIFAGIQRAQEVRYISGAIIVAILAVVVDFILGKLQDALTPEGQKTDRVG